MELNYAGIAFRDVLKKNPDFYAIGPDGEFTEKFKKQMAESAKERAELNAKNDKARTILPDLRKEYDALRQKLFNLKQDAKCFETRTNEAANRIKLCEQNINNLLRLKKEANEAGNLRGARTYEQGVVREESALADATEEFTKNKHWSGQAARVLKAFDGHARIEELRLLLDTPLPDVKSVNAPK
jgi:hypothetical protein